MTAALALSPLEREAQQIGEQSLSLVQQAHVIRVVNNDTRTQAGEMGRIIAILDGEAKEKFEAIKKPLNEAKNKVMAWEHEVRDPLDAAKKYLSRQIGDFDRVQEEERQREERLLQAEARKQAEEAAKKAAEEQAIQDAIALEAAGDTQGAAAVLANPAPVPVYVPPVVVANTVQKVSGVSGTTNWKFRVTNAALIPREYMIPDEKAIGQVVRALRNKTAIPGIEVYPDNGASFRK
jgi:hypothetical protein